MEAGAPPRGGRGRVLWLVSVEVSCCPDPVRAGVGSGVHGAGGFGAKWLGNCGGLSGLWADLIVLILFCTQGAGADSGESKALFLQDVEAGEKDVYLSHSCIHDEILHQRRRAGRKEYSVMPQVYHESQEKAEHRNVRKPIRIYLNYDAVGHSPDRDCKRVGDIVKLGEPPVPSAPGTPICDPHGNPPLVGDCWYNCTLEDIAGEDKKQRLRKALGQTVEWFRKALAVEPVKGNLRLSGYSACGQDGGVQLPHAYVEDGVANADLVLLVTTRPTTGNTLAWAVACERDQWGRAIAGHVNVAPRHLTAEAETLLSATLIHEVMHVLGFDPHAFTHFRDERKRRRGQKDDVIECLHYNNHCDLAYEITVTVQTLDEKLGRMVTRVVLPRVVMHSRHHYGAFSQNFTGLELEDGGGRGTSGSHWEKRLLMNEIMTGSVDTRSVVSRMTLALLEDSGWYQANYSMAEHLDWGRNQGTEFAISPCNSWKGAYHCNTTQLSGCTYNREAEGYCPIVSYSGDLPKWAQYFPQANKGGQSSLADYCTYYVAYSDGSCTDVNSARAPDRMLGEVRGSNSRCMASTLVRTGFVRGSMTQGNGCYQHRCTNNSLEVAVDGIWKSCPQSGGPVQFPGFNVLTVTASMGPVTASLGFMDVTAAEDLVQTSAVAMVYAKLMGSVNVKVDGQGLIVQQRSVMNNVVCMEGFAITISIQRCDEDGDNRLRDTGSRRSISPRCLKMGAWCTSCVGVGSLLEGVVGLKQIHDPNSQYYGLTLLWINSS
ncbi:uncharacterized protein C2845_PM02G04150 [Panicum miliaceum]|uniref:Leishmanolysin-like peptidase n=1 Tax=Panicum miliaceum TaxID=4540 RepID=A0A3L6SI53_PANMI|nr:uncharacterized protein C2845_PM02G04150 [Panicum miliaceum]